MISVSSFVKLLRDHKSKSGKDWKDFPCSAGDIGQVIELLDDGRLQLRMETIEGLYCKVTLDEVAESDYTPKPPPPNPSISRSQYGRGRGGQRQRGEDLPTYEEILEDGLA